MEPLNLFVVEELNATTKLLDLAEAKIKVLEVQNEWLNRQWNVDHDRLVEMQRWYQELDNRNMLLLVENNTIRSLNHRLERRLLLTECPHGVYGICERCTDGDITESDELSLVHSQDELSDNDPIWD